MGGSVSCSVRKAGTSRHGVAGMGPGALHSLPPTNKTDVVACGPPCKKWLKQCFSRRRKNDFGYEFRSV